jgi:hypothetical protein
VEDSPEAVEQLGCVSGGIAVVTVAAKNPRVYLHQYLRETSARGVGRRHCIRQRLPEDLRRMHCIRQRMPEDLRRMRRAGDLARQCLFNLFKDILYT